MQKIRVAGSIPMPELGRDFYDPSNFLYLKRVIEKDGFNEAYAVRAFWNAQKQKYEIYDGIHRLQIAGDLGYITIPAVVEKISRQEALARGIKANKTHAAYNPVDMCVHLKNLAQEVTQETNGSGRKTKYSLSVLAERTGMGEKSISQYLQLDRLPQEVKDLVGQGKLRFTHALYLLRLDKTPNRDMIGRLASQALRDGWSQRELIRRVDSILKKGYVDDTKVCACCKGAFSSERLNYLPTCPSCTQKIRTGQRISLSTFSTDEKSKARKEYLVLRSMLEKRFGSLEDIPERPRAFLEKYHERWNGSCAQLEDGD